MRSHQRKNATLFLFLCLSFLLSYCATGNNFGEAKRLYDTSVATDNQAEKKRLREKIIDLAPDSPWGLFSQGYLSGDDDRAIDLYRRALKSDQSLYPALYNMGNSYLRKGDLEKALENFSAALAINASYADALNNRGIVYVRRGDYAKALTDFTRAIRIKKDFIDAYRNRAKLHALMGNHELAAGDRKKARNYQKGTTAHERENLIP